MGTPLVFKNLFEGYVPRDIQSKRTHRIFRQLGLAKEMANTIRARRLNGIWTRKNLASNGAIEDLDHFFCLEGKVRKNVDSRDPLSDATHAEICGKYDENERRSLKEFILDF